MKFKLISALILCTSLAGMAQDCSSERYLSNIFQSSVSQDIVFGNSPALTTVYVAENVTVNQSMTMDIFFPVGDLLPKRPAVVLAYGGGYLFGTKEDEDVWATCDSLAKKGYVTASINYRMNLNAVDPSSAVRAIYRAAQDYSSAIRFLKEFSNTYRIDTNYLFVGGVSAGGFSAMHAVYLDDSERPAETFQSGIFGATPDLGCINCAGNSYDHTTNVRGIINLWGALMDTAYIQQDELVPMTLFHGSSDLIVPYDYGFPFTALFLMPEVFGSVNVAERVNNLGGNAELNVFQGVGHNIWGVNVNNQLVGGPTEHWTPITDSIISFLYENIRPQALTIQSTLVCQGQATQLQASPVPADGHACWSIEGGTLVSANEDSSQITVIWNTAGNYEVTAVSVNHLDAYSTPTTVQVEVFPVSALTILNDNGTLQASAGFASYQWFLDGQELVGEDQSILNVSGPGSYTVQAITADGCTVTSDAELIVGILDPLSFGNRIDHILLFDLAGREIARLSGSELNSLRTKTGVRSAMMVKYMDVKGQTIKTALEVLAPIF